MEGKSRAPMFWGPGTLPSRTAYESVVTTLSPALRNIAANLPKLKPRLARKLNGEFVAQSYQPEGAEAVQSVLQYLW